MMLRDHPCQKDCPDRNATCKKTCEKLKAYTEKKLKAEAEKEKRYKIDQYEIEMMLRRQKKITKGNKKY